MLTHEAEQPAPSDPEAYLEAFLEELQLHRHSVSQQTQTRHVVCWFLKHLKEKGVQDLRAVSEAHLRSFLRLLQNSKNRRGAFLSAWTQGAYLSRLRGFFAFLGKRSIILRNPAAAIRLPQARRLPRPVLTQRQVERLLEAPSPTTTLGQRDRALLETFYGTAIRLSECRRLEVSDVDLHTRELWVRNGKGRKDRLVPIPRRAVEALDLYLKEARANLVHRPGETALFLSRPGKRMSETLIHVLLRDYGRAAGIPHPVYPHGLRHACGTHLLQRGADLRHIQELLGHNQIQTTALYTRVNVKDLGRMLARSHPRERARRRIESSRSRRGIRMKRRGGTEVSR